MTDSEMPNLDPSILAYSLDGCLRLRRVNGKRSIIEIRSHLYPGDWTWCVQRQGWATDEALAIFLSQCERRLGIKFTKPVVQPGI